MKLVLASGSPRRKELLEALGLKFDVLITDTDEDAITSQGIGVDLYVQELALMKAAEAAKLLIKNKNVIIIAADTVVTYDGEILGKPKDKIDAFNMLKKLSNKEHQVFT
ncbi:MAG: Maf family protein, partial [Clostridia bacterium]|nr:Maf family protein [Clostridia bacterium]